MTHNIFKELMNMFTENMNVSAVQMRTIHDLPEDTWHDGDKVQTRNTMSQPTLYTILFCLEL